MNLAMGSHKLSQPCGQLGMAVEKAQKPLPLACEQELAGNAIQAVEAPNGAWVWRIKS